MHGEAERISRRTFFSRSGACLASLAIVPRHLLGGSGGVPPSDRIAVACIGVGGRGAANLKAVKGEHVVALCDVDDRSMAKAAREFPDAKRFRDYRKMLDDLGRRIDAVVVSTPDHTHAVAAMAAIRKGKHVYCEKPLAHSIHEVRALQKAARDRKVVTQLGNQGHSSDTIRSFCEWIRDGAIGAVHTVHATCANSYSRIADLPRLTERPPVPPELNWDLWVGPAASRPYHPLYLPATWRGWFPFGTGIIGDWTCHVVDPVFWALDLGSPDSVEARVDGFDPAVHGDTFPPGAEIRFEFPARAKRGAVALVWFDGSRRPPRPAGLEEKKKLPDTGAVVIGEKGTIVYGSHGALDLRLIPDARMKAYKKPAKTIPRVKEHHADWFQAIRRGRAAGSSFDYGGPLTEIALLGVIATRFPGRKLRWDGAAMKFTDCEEANSLLRPRFRAGWSL